MNDLISRKELLNFMDAIIPANPNLDDYTKGVAVGIAMAKVVINGMKPAENYEDDLK